MTLKFLLICAGSWMVFSCDPKNSSESSGTDAAGIYVREYATEITNQNTGDKIGMRQIRDTIIVERIEDEYKITNRKWRLNDYDQEGWVNMEHADDRPLATFLAVYDEATLQFRAKAKPTPIQFF